MAYPGSASEGQRDGTSGDGRDLDLLVPLDGQVGREPEGEAHRGGLDFEATQRCKRRVSRAGDKEWGILGRLSTRWLEQGAEGGVSARGRWNLSSG